MSLLLAASGDIASGVVEAEGVDFDGVNDYLSRSTDLTGNVDSKTFTFSCWVYHNDQGVILRSQIPSTQYSGLRIYTEADGRVVVDVFNISNAILCRCEPASYTPASNTWNHFLVSVDLTSTSKRKLYINDTLYSDTVFSNYVNDTINFTNTKWLIGCEDISGTNSKYLKGRLSNIFLDYTYRDLSIEANRRLFITADGKPTPTATLKALNPILYLPMKDAATAHINEGTGGNFVQNGTLDTASRGANQDNCKASYFDGVADYLSRTSLTGATDTKTITLSFILKDANGYVLYFSNSDASRVQFYTDGSTYYWLLLYNSSGVQVVSWNFYYSGLLAKQTHSFVISLDTSDFSKAKVFIDGKDVTNNTTPDIFVVDSIVDAMCNSYYIGRRVSTYYTQIVGELYFDTKYTDLATSNPFWDAVENKPIPVRKVIANTGVTPLIAMPLDASNAGKNYGSGGDFVANSAPYVGARGASEVWQRTAKFDGSTSYLSRAGLTGITDTKTITLVGYVYKTASTLYHLVGSTNSNVSISINASNQLVITAKNTAGTTILSATVTTAIANVTWTSILLSIDLSNTANRSVYLNGVLASVTWTTYTNDTIDFTNASWVVGADIALGNKYNGTLAIMLDNTYIDFTSEVNRLKYIDGLSYPLSINEQVAKGIITKPALYLAFEDTSNLGINSGYGGNFTVNGTVTQGADVNG